MSKTRITEAVRALDVGAVRALLDANPALLNVVDQRGRNLLHLACSAPCADLGMGEAESAKMVTLLLDRGLDVDSQLPPDRDKCTALFFAVARGRNTTLIKLLLKRGADVRKAPGGGLFAAAWWNSTAHLDLLLEAGADIEQVVGVTPFLAAWMWRNFDAAKFLAKKGAKLNVQEQKGRTALHWGVEKEFDPALLSWLVKRGASPDVKDRDGVTARERASRKRDKKWLNALG